LKRNDPAKYSAIAAQKDYTKRRKKSRRKRLLDRPQLYEKVAYLFLHLQWSPEQIAARLKHEQYPFPISYTTIYRAIYARMFDPPGISRGHRGAVRKLRHRGKRRRPGKAEETRGKIRVTHQIHDRPKAAETRREFGHWEADTVVGKRGSACLVTLTDRRSRFLLAARSDSMKSEDVKEVLLRLLAPLPSNRRRSVTPDRGVEFAKHAEVSRRLDDMPFYFADPRAPWQRGTNENTNGLIREYLPKHFDMADCTQQQIDDYIHKINLRPRKCLDWKAPYEAFFCKVLHFT
jgi:IS30 family transposase